MTRHKSRVRHTRRRRSRSRTRSRKQAGGLWGLFEGNKDDAAAPAPVVTAAPVEATTKAPAAAPATEAPKKWHSFITDFFKPKLTTPAVEKQKGGRRKKSRKHHRHHRK